MYLLSSSRTVRIFYNAWKCQPSCPAAAARFFATVNPSKSSNQWPTWQLPKGHDTGIKVYNTVVKSKVPLITQQPGLLTWYMCGPTVYDSPHIGHGLCYVRFDIIRRILQDYFKLNVVQVMGVTDIDDKIIRKANYFKVDINEVSRHFEAEFVRDMTALSVLRPTLSTRVTDHIEHIIQFIQAILDKGLAYQVADGSVFFNNIAYRKSRGLSLPDDAPNESSSGPDSSDDAETDVYKRHPIDFALWKGSRKGEPAWPAPFGSGRPGWHIECSAMACSVFGQCLDVHSGGIDLWFPHHSAEEAQSCARHSANKWTNYWWHSGHLTIDSEKMSKSVGNIISVQDLLKQHSANTFRHYALCAHYTHEVRFHDDTLSLAASQVNKIQQMLDGCLHFITSSTHSSADTSFVSIAPDGAEDLFNSTTATASDSSSTAVHPLLQELQRTKQCVDACLRDDFNTAHAMRYVLALVSLTNSYLYGGSQLESSSQRGTLTEAMGTQQRGALVQAAREQDAESLLQSSFSQDVGVVVQSSNHGREVIQSSCGNDKELLESAQSSFNVEQTSQSSSSDVLQQQQQQGQAGLRVSSPAGRYEVAAVRNYILDLMQMLGMNYNTRQTASLPRTEGSSGAPSDLDVKFPDVMQSLLNFRQSVRDFALLKDLTEEQLASMSKAEKKSLRVSRSLLLDACDELRVQLSASALIVKDHKDGSSWCLADDISLRSGSQKEADD